MLRPERHKLNSCPRPQRNTDHSRSARHSLSPETSFASSSQRPQLRHPIPPFAFWTLSVLGHAEVSSYNRLCRLATGAVPEKVLLGLRGWGHYFIFV